MLLSQHAGRHDVGQRRLQLVLPSADDVSVATHHGIEADPRDLRRIVLFGASDFGIEHIRPRKELGFGRTGHQAGYTHAGIVKLGTQGKREGIEKRFAAVVNGLIGARNEARDRARDENAPFSLRSHIASDPPNEVEHASDISVHDPPSFGKILFQKVSAESAAGIRQEEVDRPTVSRGAKPVDSLHCGKVRFNSMNLDTLLAQSFCRLLDARLVGSYDQVMAVVRAFLCEEVADAR